jgi:hypothetical protein
VKEQRTERVRGEVRRGNEEIGQELWSLNGGSATGSRWEGGKGRFEEPGQVRKDLQAGFGALIRRSTKGAARSKEDYVRLSWFQNSCRARSLVISPKFILLDEPFSGIDPITVLEIQKIIKHLKSKQIGVLITDHNVRETLQVTDRAYIINNGSIFRSGTPKELGNDAEVKRVYLGEHFSLN